MHKKKITPTGALLYVFLTVVLVFMMIPFVWLLISSLRPNADLFNEPFAVPKTLSFENFRAIFNKEESDGIIFHVPFYSYQCIYGAILCYD